MSEAYTYTVIHILQVPPPSIFAEATKSLSVVIPAYNEEDRLPVTLEDLIG